jgi:predicted amidohydrolase
MVAVIGRVRIGAACIEVSSSKAANLDAIEACAREAAERGVRLLILPECAVQGYPLGLGLPDLDQYERQLKGAEPVPGPATELLTGLAVELGLELVVGLTERPTESGSAGKLFNTAVLIGPGGVVVRYRKIHTGGVEKCLWSRGSEWAVADTLAGKLGLLICYDLVFPEAARCLALAGTQLLTMPTAWPNDDTEGGALRSGYDLFTRARALENQVYLVSANLVGGEGKGFYGHSRIVDPRGEVIAESEGPGIAVADLDLDQQVPEFRARSWFGQVFLNDREPRAYEALARSVASP